MAEIRLTAAQQAAVEDRGGALLVSAAAGSGKTKVLVDRLMSMVCDPIRPKNINEFLIITYTRAAAAELRSKISAELGNRLAAQPGNRHLQRQLSLVYLTEISTVHAFCANLLRTYAHMLDIPADFRVAEESESAQLRQRCLEQVLEEAYAHLEQMPRVRTFIDLLGHGRDDRGVADAVETLYRAAQCHPDPAGWMTGCDEALSLEQYADCTETPWGRYLLEQFREFLDVQCRAMARAVDAMLGVDALEKAYLPGFQSALAQLEALRALADWDRLATSIPTSFDRLSPVRKFEDKAFLERLKNIRGRCLEGLRRWSDVFYGSNEEVMADLSASCEALRGGLEIVSRLRSRFALEKRRRRMMDFSDLEQETIRLLTDRTTGRPTTTALEVAQRYVEVLVDEYQDSNEVQERIFAAISQDGRNRFMVGDVKQSIYRFRLADPSIFLRKYRAFADRGGAAEGEPRKILLSENFRSRPEILSAANHVFRTVMSEAVGDLDYGDEEALKPGLAFSPSEHPMVELHCMEPRIIDGAAEKVETEADFVAQRIAALLSGETLQDADGARPIRPEDVVILLRSVGSTAPDYMEALRARGIPCACDRGESVLDSREVETLLSILEVIDNPHRDIPLASALSSPIFEFSAQELAEIRAANRQGDFYDALQAYAGRSEKAVAFLEWLLEFRRQARWLPLHTLVRRVYEATRIEAVFGAMAGSRQRRVNLQTFFEMAAEFAADGKATLMEFLNYVNDQRQQGMALLPPEQASGGAVRIMSIHKSKGLEFPVVVLADLSRQFNTEDLRRQVMTHPRLFAASSVIDWENGVRFPTIAKKALAMCAKQEDLSEELRVLYVAMTRAKNRLIMTYCSRFLTSELTAIAEEAAYPVQPEFAARAKNPGWWVLMAAMCRSEAGELFAVGGPVADAASREHPWEIRVVEPAAASPASWEETTSREPLSLPDDETLLDAMAYRYPHQQAVKTPAKVTATQLKGREVDREATEDAAPLVPPGQKPIRRPDFITERQALTATERGTANHLFLQFVDYAACTTAVGVQRELERLVEKAFLTAAQAEAVDVGHMVRLFGSPLGQRILSCGNVVRELKFSILADASLIAPQAEGERVMLQGVVDCLLDEPEGLTIIDFKTDAVGEEGVPRRAATYAPQLRAYGAALARIYERPVRQLLLYFLRTGAAVEIEAR